MKRTPVKSSKEVEDNLDGLFEGYEAGSSSLDRTSPLRTCVDFSVSAIFGAILGFLASFLVNSCLVEIAINSFFAVYFGIFFCLSGAWLISTQFYYFNTAGATSSALAAVASTRSSSSSSVATSTASTSTMRFRRVALVVFGCVLLLSGFLSLSFRREWLFTMGAFSKIVIFSFLGVALSFGIVFTLVDTAALIHDISVTRVSSLIDKPVLGLIETPSQIFLIFCASIVMGCTYGVIFGGIARVGESALGNYDVLSRELRRDFVFSAVFGGAVGATVAVLNESLRRSDFHVVGAAPVSMTTTSTANLGTAGAQHRKTGGVGDGRNAYSKLSQHDIEGE